jgi:branched-chain amino acid transport system substrate-binding protein
MVIFSRFLIVVLAVGLSTHTVAGIALADGTIKVASIYALTGVAANATATSVRGIRAGIRDINNRGGVLGKKLELLELDNHSTPIGSKVAADQAVQAGVVAIWGASWSSHSLAVARVAQVAKVPMITNISTHPAVTEVGDYIFRVCFDDRFQGQVMATFARRELNASRAVTFVDVASDYSLELAREFKRSFEKQGGQVALELHYKQKQEAFAPLVKEAKQASPDVLFIPGYDESFAILRDAAEAGLNTIPIGGDGWDSPDLLRLGHGFIKQAYYCTHWAREANGKATNAYLASHMSPENVRAPEVLAYDAVHILADAIRRAGSLDRAKIRDALAATRDFKGLTGTITFDANRQVTKAAVIMKITDGGEHFFKTVTPDQ